MAHHDEADAEVEAVVVEGAALARQQSHEHQLARAAGAANVEVQAADPEARTRLQVRNSRRVQLAVVSRCRRTCCIISSAGIVLLCA